MERLGTERRPVQGERPARRLEVGVELEHRDPALGRSLPHRRGEVARNDDGPGVEVVEVEVEFGTTIGRVERSARACSSESQKRGRGLGTVLDDERDTIVGLEPALAQLGRHRRDERVKAAVPER